MSPDLPDSVALPGTFPGAPAPTKTCAVMVTRNPDPSLEENIRLLLPEVDDLIVVDNGSEPAARSTLGAIAEASGFEVIWNAANVGLAAALNAGIRHALAKDDYSWIATFDEDSRVSPGFRKAFQQAWSSCPFRDRIGVMGPYHVLFPEDPSARALQLPVSPPFVERRVMLQSGSLLSVAGLRHVGMLDESFFIDYVDFEFCLRVRKHGLRVIEASNAALAHRVGAPSLHSIGKLHCVVLNHSPIRRYYAARNRLRVYRRYLLSDPAWICHDAWSWFKQIIKLLLYEQDRGRKLAGMAEGAWDALRGRSGPYRGRPDFPA